MYEEVEGIATRESIRSAAGVSVYLILEVVIIELVGVGTSREFDLEFGVHLFKVVGAGS